MREKRTAVERRGANILAPNVWRIRPHDREDEWFIRLSEPELRAVSAVCRDKTWLIYALLVRSQKLIDRNRKRRLETPSVSGKELKRLGINKATRARAFIRLAKAGLITLDPVPGHAPVITLAMLKPIIVLANDDDADTDGAA